MFKTKMIAIALFLSLTGAYASAQETEPVPSTPQYPQPQPQPPQYPVESNGLIGIWKSVRADCVDQHGNKTPAFVSVSLIQTQSEFAMATKFKNKKCELNGTYSLLRSKNINYYIQDCDCVSLQSYASFTGKLENRVLALNLGHEAAQQACPNQNGPQPASDQSSYKQTVIVYMTKVKQY